jgi:hypothetical protein
MIGFFALLAMPTCGLIASFKTFQMVDKVNARLPKQEHFDPLWWYLSRRQRLVREYKRLYPDGPLPTHSRIAMQWPVLGQFSISVSTRHYRNAGCT